MIERGADKRPIVENGAGQVEAEAVGDGVGLGQVVECLGRRELQPEESEFEGGSA